jgi:hypothetical protein
MCAMTRQPVRARLLLLAAFGATVVACGLDKQGTEFAPSARETQLDGGLALAQGRPDAGSAREGSDDVPQAVGAAGSADAAGQALSSEGSSSQEAASTTGLASGVDGSFEAASSAPAFDSDGDAAPPDGSLSDASPPDASPPDDSPAATGSSCDQDGDGYMAAGPPCYGNDCCDTDANVHPGQTAYFTTPSQCGSYDYDCDGTATPEYGLADCTWTGLGCTGDGFVDATACGATAAFSVCASTGLLTCTASVGSLTQACR